MRLLNIPLFQTISTMNAKISVSPVYECQNVSPVCLVEKQGMLDVVQYYKLFF